MNPCFWLLDADCPKRSTGELASYQQKMYRIDDHVGIAIAGLTSDARVLRYASRIIRSHVLKYRLVISCVNKPWLNG